MHEEKHTMRNTMLIRSLLEYEAGSDSYEDLRQFMIPPASSTAVPNGSSEDGEDDRWP